MTISEIIDLIEKAAEARRPYFDTNHESAFRLFNGFAEGNLHLSIDIYAGTALFNNYHPDVPEGAKVVDELASLFQKSHFPALSWLRAGIIKSRNSPDPLERRGILLFGDRLERKIKEHGIWHAINLTMDKDASFYLDTRNLRKWLIENMRGKSVLNTFAYTGSLGTAATAGGASQTVQIDLNHQYLNQAKDSYSLNGFPIQKRDFITADFFPAISKLKSSKQLFDCVILDPPFFSLTAKGRVDLENESARLINKVRPLVKKGGQIIAINNALFLSGKEYIDSLEMLCKDGYLKIKELLAVPQDVIGYAKVNAQITDPAPFTHSTKIAVLEVTQP